MNMNFRRATAQHPGINWALGAVEFMVIDALMILGITPAWAAVSIPLTDKITVNLGELPNWIVALVAAGGLFRAWRAEQRAAEAANLAAQAVEFSRSNTEILKEVGVKIDGMLVERDKAKVKEGEVKGLQAAAVGADKLAEGMELGRKQERESVAAANPVAAVASAEIVAAGEPVPVADEKTGGATERSAEALERLADATEDTADTVKKL